MMQGSRESAFAYPVLRTTSRIIIATQRVQGKKKNRKLTYQEKKIRRESESEKWTLIMVDTIDFEISTRFLRKATITVLVTFRMAHELCLEKPLRGRLYRGLHLPEPLKKGTA